MGVNDVRSMNTAHCDVATARPRPSQNPSTRSRSRGWDASCQTALAKENPSCLKHSGCFMAFFAFKTNVLKIQVLRGV